MQIPSYLRTILLVLSIGGLLAACSNSGGGIANAPAGTAVSGAVSKGPVTGATVDIYTMTTTGAQGTFVIGNIPTDQYGAWNATLPAGQVGPFLVIATGGSYVDEYTGATIRMGNASFQGVMEANATTAPISPITDAAISTLRQMIVDGYANNVAAALPKVKASYTASVGFDPLTVLPPAPQNLATATADQKKYAALLGGVSKLVNDAYTQLTVGAAVPNPVSIVKLMAADLGADGIINGQGSGGISLSVSVGGTPKALNTVFAGGANLGAATTTYQASPNAPAALAGTQVTVTPPNFNQTLFDKILPVVSAPAAITVATAAGATAVAATNATIATFLTAATATDNVGIVGAITNNAPTSFPVGVTTVTFSATDAAGNIGTATATVTVSATPAVADTIAPTVTAPASITVPTAAGATSVANTNAAIATFLAAATATDNVGVVGAITNNAPATFPVGVTTVTFSAKDAANNSGTATANVTVTATPAAGGDTVPPVITPPADITVIAGAGIGFISKFDNQLSAFRFAATALDNVDGPIFTITDNMPNSLPLGQTTVTFSASDLAGNVGTATAIVTVVAGKAAPNLTLQLSNPTPSANDLYRIVHSGAGYAAVGNKGTAISSQDGYTWSAGKVSATLSGQVLQDVAWGNGMYVAISFFGNSIFSTDGINWSAPFSMGVPRYAVGITFGNGMFVAVGSAGNVDPYAGILTSVDGYTWVKQVSPTSNGLGDVIWTGTQFVAVGMNGVIVTSPDGITWTVQTTPASTSTLNSISTNGTTLVAVGGSAPNALSTVMTSSDGITWTQQLTGIIQGVVYDVVWSGSQFVAVGSGDWTTGQNVMTSPDGVSWTKQASGLAYGSILRGVTVDTVSGLIIAVGNSGDILTSMDGVTWTNRKNDIAPDTSMGDVIWTGTQYVAVGSPNMGGAAATILTSVDGYAWTRQTSPLTSGGLKALATNGTLLVAAGSEYNPGLVSAIETSTDGVTWTKQVIADPYAINDVIWSAGHNMFIAVGNSGMISTSPDGVTWTSQTSGIAAESIVGVASDGAMLVAVAPSWTPTGTIIVTSSDGITWSTLSTTGNAGMQSIIWDGVQFVAAGSSGQLMLSPDGINWTLKYTNLSNFWINNIYWSGSSYICVGLTSNIATSADLVNWRQITSPAFQLFGSAQNGNGQTVIVGNAGNSGLILTGQ